MDSGKIETIIGVKDNDSIFMERTLRDMKDICDILHIRCIYICFFNCNN